MYFQNNCSAGTSVGANVEEAIWGQSFEDFLAKMYISLKEGRETNYWLRLLKESGLVKVNFDPAIKESEEIVNVISSIVKTSKERLKLRIKN